MKHIVMPGEEIDIPSVNEIGAEFERVHRRTDAEIRELVRGVKPIRFHAQKTITFAAGAPASIAMTNGPKPGYVWSILSFNTIWNNTSWAIASIYKVESLSDLSPYANSNTTPQENFPYLIDNPDTSALFTRTYSKGTILLNAGELMVVAGWQSLVGTSTVSIYGSAVEVPAEMVGKLYL